MSPERPGLDLSSIEAIHQGTEAPPNNHADGRERRFILGEENAAVAVDVYPTHPAFVRILTRTGEEVVAMGRVRSVVPHENGILIRNQQTECLVASDGFIIFTHTPPEPELIPFQEAPVGQRRGKYTQAVLETGQTKEGERVEKEGMVEAAPKRVNQERNSALQFVLVVDDPEKKGGKDRLEVYAKHSAKQKLQRDKLVRGDRIQAVLYRHTWEDETIGGERLTHTRYNLAAITRIERKDEITDAKRSPNRRGTKKE